MIRAAEKADVPAMLAIYAPYVLKTTITFEYAVPALSEFEDRFSAVTEKLPWLVWEEKGAVLGYAYASLPFTRAAYAWCAEPSIYLRSDARGRGIGKRLYAALEAILLELGYVVSYAIITGENAPSLAFHYALGYRKCGELVNSGQKFGRWLDVYWLEKRLNSVETPRNSPIPWKEFSKNIQKFSDILGKMSLSESAKV
ncbi:MAG: N-acetyltransferase family protein [Candidatus Faecousia sp.]|nr:N-acetyltransferase family protein [Candidatus Faecousia sp.]